MNDYQCSVIEDRIQEIEMRNGTLEEAQEKIQEAQDRLTAALSHEIKLRTLLFKLKEGLPREREPVGGGRA